MSSLNQVTLVGRLGADPEVRHTTNDKAVANFRIATSETWRDKESGEKRERTEWHTIEVWGKQAETCGEYLSKGRSVCVQGKLRTKSWEKDGVTHYRTQIAADNVLFLGGGKSAAGEPNYEITDDDIPY